MTFAVWSHEFVADGTAFYVRGPLSGMEAFLLVTPIPAMETWGNAVVTHFPCELALSNSVDKNVGFSVSPRMQGSCGNSAHLWAPEKAGVRQTLLIFSPRLALGTPENAGVT